MFREKITLQEVSSQAVNVKWFYKNDDEWYGEFDVDNIKYDVSFTREDKKHNIKDFKIVSLKFAKPDLDDPHAFSKDFNKPIVVKNTILKELESYILTEKIDMFITKALTSEKTRVQKYRVFVHSLVRDFGFIFEDEVKKGKYVHFLLLRNKEVFIDRKNILNSIEK